MTTADNNDRNPCPTPECGNDAVGDDLDPCAECQERDAYWERQFNRSGRREVAERYTRDDIRDCYSDPTESAKREAMLKTL